MWFRYWLQYWPIWVSVLDLNQNSGFSHTLFQSQTEYDKEVVSLQKKGYGMTDKPKHFKLYANYSEQTLRKKISKKCRTSIFQT